MGPFRRVFQGFKLFEVIELPVAGVRSSGFTSP